GQEWIAVEVRMCSRVATDAGVINVPDRVMANVKVEIAVAVEVGESRRSRPVPPAPQAPGVRRVLEGAFAPVAVERIRPPTGDEEIGPAITVDVADRHTVPVAAVKPCDAGSLARVLKRAVAPVVEQPIAAAGVSATRRIMLKRTALNAVHVEPAIA